MLMLILTTLTTKSNFRLILKVMPASFIPTRVPSGWNRRVVLQKIPSCSVSHPTNILIPFTLTSDCKVILKVVPDLSFPHCNRQERPILKWWIRSLPTQWWPAQSRKESILNSLLMERHPFICQRHGSGMRFLRFLVQSTSFNC